MCCFRACAPHACCSSTANFGQQSGVGAANDYSRSLSPICKPCPSQATRTLTTTIHLQCSANAEITLAEQAFLIFADLPFPRNIAAQARLCITAAEKASSFDASDSTDCRRPRRDAQHLGERMFANVCPSRSTATGYAEAPA